MLGGKKSESEEKPFSSHLYKQIESTPDMTMEKPTMNEDVSPINNFSWFSSQLHNIFLAKTYGSDSRLPGSLRKNRSPRIFKILHHNREMFDKIPPCTLPKTNELHLKLDSSNRKGLFVSQPPWLSGAN